VEKKTNI